VRSIRTRLLVGLLSSMVLVLLAGAALIFFTIQDEAAELFDHQLEHAAYASAAQPPPAHPQEEPEDNPEQDFVTQIWSADGQLRFQSRPLEQPLRQTSPGFADVAVKGEAWRAFSLRLEDKTVQVAQPLRVRNAVARTTTLETLSMFSLLFPLAAVLIYATVGRGLRPLTDLTAAVRRRSHRDLTPIDAVPLPSEVAPLAMSLNDLMAHLERVLAVQKTFVADAAHELLTPITALQLQAQLVSRAPDEERRYQALSDLRAGLVRTIHLARQLLTLAQQDPDLQHEPMVSVDLGELAHRVVLTQRPLAEAKSIDLQLSAPAMTRAQGVPDGLATLLGALLDNAIKYTPAGGRITVIAAAREGQPALVIEDSGPGVPEEEHARIFDRFYRRPGSQGFGSGLGLSIAHDIATRHGAEIRLEASAALGGLMVSVIFGV
jgi:two-component system, OmpR family, sensor kinase